MPSAASKKPEDSGEDVKRKVKMGKHPAVREYMKKIASETSKDRKERIKKENVLLKKFHETKVKRNIGLQKRRLQERRSRVRLARDDLLKVVKRVKGYKKISLKRTRKPVMLTNAKPRLVEKVDGKYFLKLAGGRKVLVNSKFVKEKKW